LASTAVTLSLSFSSPQIRLVFGPPYTIPIFSPDYANHNSFPPYRWSKSPDLLEILFLRRHCHFGVPTVTSKIHAPRQIFKASDLRLERGIPFLKKLDVLYLQVIIVTLRGPT